MKQCWFMDMADSYPEEWLLTASQPIATSCFMQVVLSWCYMQVAYAGVSTVVFIVYYLPELYKWIQSQTSMPPGAFCTSKQVVPGSQPTAKTAADADLRRRQLSGMHQPLSSQPQDPLSLQPPPPPPPVSSAPPPWPLRLQPLRPLLFAAPPFSLLPISCSCCVAAPATWMI